METCEGTGLSPYGDTVSGRVCTTFPFECKGPNCQCLGNSCEACTVTGQDSFVCSACAEGWLPFGGSCLKSATCKNDKVEDKGLPCKCSKTCNKCTLASAPGGGVTEVCLVCKRKTYLSGGECLATGDLCPEGTVAMGEDSEGRVCAVPFTCTKRKNSVTGKKCKCSDNKNCVSCR